MRTINSIDFLYPSKYKGVRCSMMNFAVISTGQQARAENVLSHFCSIHQANARVHKGKLQPLAGDQSDRDKAQNYCGGGSEARGDDKQ